MQISVGADDDDDAVGGGDDGDGDAVEAEQSGWKQQLPPRATLTPA